jgi:uncharacterized protein YbbK (DUF523 family)
MPLTGQGTLREGNSNQVASIRKLEITVILVSACLLGIDCKYNGSNSLNKAVLEFLKDKSSFVVCCPELLGGLPTPRGPYEITGGTGKDVIEEGARVKSDKGEDVTKEFLKGAREALEVVQKNDIRTAILKARSPSCGVDRIYDGTFSGILIKGDGVAAALLRSKGIRLISDEGMWNQGEYNCSPTF